MNWTVLLTQEMTATYRATENLMAMLTDDDLDWKPATGENWMTVGQLLHHINGSCGMCCRGFVTGDWGAPEAPEQNGPEAGHQLPTAAQMPTVASLAAAREGLAADRAVAFQMIEQAGPDNLASLELTAPWDPGTPRLLGHHLLQMVHHLEVHKAQLFYYLKLMGRKVDTMTLWGM